MNCWEFMRCGREGGGARADELGICPAWPDKGHNCAKIAGTLCHGKAQGSFASKISSCLQCSFYNSPNYEHENILVD